MPSNAHIRLAALAAATIAATLGVYGSFRASSVEPAPIAAPPLRQQYPATSSVIARLPVERDASSTALALPRPPAVRVAVPAPVAATPRVAAPAVVRAAPKPFRLPQVPREAAPVQWKPKLVAPQLPHAPMTSYTPKKKTAPVIRTVAAVAPVVLTHLTVSKAPAPPDLDSVPTPKLP